MTSWRTPGTTDQYLPVEAKIKLDAYDFKTQASWWDDVLLHEMTHALGFSGNVFQGLHLLDAAGNFIGSNATAAYGAAFVPIESSGGTEPRALTGRRRRSSPAVWLNRTS